MSRLRDLKQYEEAEVLRKKVEFCVDEFLAKNNISKADFTALKEKILEIEAQAPLGDGPASIGSL